MGRIRTVKPELLIHEKLQDLEVCMKLPVIVVFIGLLTQADREGRFRWKPRVLKLAILPFMSFDMETAMNGLHYAGFVLKYEIDGEVYGSIPTFSEHQFVNAHEKQSDLPAYEDAYACTCIIPQGIDKKMHARGEGKGREKEGKRKRKAPSDVGADASPVFISIPLAGEGQHEVTEADVASMEKSYPAVDVCQALRDIVAWNEANPTKRKTVSGVREHIRRWLSKAQDTGRSSQKGSHANQPQSRTGLSAGDVEEVAEIFRRIETGEAYAGDNKPLRH
jgi:hypothetical protein